MQNKEYCEKIWYNYVKEKICKGEAVNLDITTDSMSPFIRPMDKVVVRNCNAKDLRKGDIALFNIDHRLYIHRLFEKENNNGEALFITKGDKGYTADPPLTEKQFMGKVVKINRDSKIINLEKQPWILASRFFYLISILKARSLPVIRTLKYCLHIQSGVKPV